MKCFSSKIMERKCNYCRNDPDPLDIITGEFLGCNFGVLICNNWSISRIKLLEESADEILAGIFG